MSRGVIYLIDGTYNLFRAYHATPRMSTTKGLPTNAVLAFTQMLRKLVTDERPAYLGIAFDTEKPTFRHEAYEEYKSQRPPAPDDLLMQIPYVRRVCEAFRAPILELDGYEADDVIATLAERAKSAGHDVIVVTSDKDLFQLVDDKVKILNPAKGNLMMDSDTVEEVFGVPPRQVPEVLALWGDASDNIPGVPGIGEKGAKEIIRRFATIEEAHAHADEIKRKAYREGLKNHLDEALECRELVTVRRDAPIDLDLDLLKLRDPDGQAAYALFSELEFTNLSQEFAPREERAESTHRVIEDPAELKRIAEKARENGILSIAIATDGGGPTAAKIVGIALCSDHAEACYVPVGHSILGATGQIPLEQVLEGIRGVIEDPELSKIGHNIKHEWILLARHDLTPRGIGFDSMVASYLIDPGRRQHNLDSLTLDHLSTRVAPRKEITGTGKSEVTLDQVEVEKVAGFAGDNALAVLRLKEVLEPRLQEMELDELFQEVEIPLISVLADLELNGILIDTEVLGSMSKKFAAEMARIEKEIYELAGCSFNINSPAQLGDVLFEKLELSSRKRTAKTKARSTSMQVLEELASQHPLPRKILDYRSLSKLKSTYIDALPQLLNPETGRVHTSFNQTVAATGRLSSSDPNLQNIPARTDLGRKIRAAFVPEKGCLLLAADYSQVELRIMAHMADVPELVDAFRKGEDIHERTAMEVFGVEAGEVNSQMRTQAKTINFGVMYGMGSVRLAAQLGIKRKEAQQFIARYFERFPRIKEYIDETIERAEKDGFVTTLFNRRRYFPDINSPDRMARQQALRAAVNTTIQGTAADLMKKAMLGLHAALREKRFRSKMLLQVHDELVLECPEEEVDKVKKVVSGCMEEAAALRTPLIVNVKVGTSWEAVT